jgi:hypothetical protein
MPTPDPLCPYPHLGEGPWECCQIFAENFPTNQGLQAGAPEDDVLPGWTAQAGNLAPNVEPRVICPVCEAEYTIDEIHDHTRIAHHIELAVTADNRDPHPYKNEQDHGH